jgi:hypothetical protein
LLIHNFTRRGERRLKVEAFIHRSNILGLLYIVLLLFDILLTSNVDRPTVDAIIFFFLCI